MIINNIKVRVDYTEPQLLKKIAKACNVRDNDIASYKLIKRSVDARDKNNVCFVMGFDVALKSDNFKAVNDIADKGNCPPAAVAAGGTSGRTAAGKTVVVGSGPAGIFCALTLAEAGHRPIVIERGGEVEKRRAKVELFKKTGLLDTESNVQFGEGGAGTFSDGKLHTGINDKRCDKVIRTFYEAGAPEEILWQAKPHIGTDKLITVVKNLREKIKSLGGEVMFDTCVTDVFCENGIVQGIEIKKPDGTFEQIQCDNVVFAIGHSSRDTVEMLLKRGVEMEKKPFAVGVRIEHPRKMIDESRYGKFASSKRLGAAEYKMSCRTSSGRGVYTFCMCPGGTVVAAASEEGGICVNGMSEFARDAENSNSALLVGITPEDTDMEDVLAGIKFQRELERAAFKIGGSNYKAPVQLYGDLMLGKASDRLGDVRPSYMPGVTPADLHECLPAFVTSAIAEGVHHFARQIEGFDRYDAVLTGVEARSSSPVRMLRNENMEARIKGLYPCGEGAGYAGGITSAAVDGIKVAEKILGIR